MVVALFDLFVALSCGEHLDFVLVEAMAMEKPVIATSAGDVPEVVCDGETHRLVPPADLAGLAAVVVRLVADREGTARLGRDGRHRAVAEFGLARHVSAVERAYRDALGCSR